MEQVETVPNEQGWTDTTPSAPKGTALAKFVQSLEDIGAKYGGYTNEGGSWHCPLHDDDTASLDVTIGDNGKPIWHCFPCVSTFDNRKEGYTQALKEAGVSWFGRPLTPEEADEIDWGNEPCDEKYNPEAANSSPRGTGGDCVASYYYEHADGSPNFKALRFEKGKGENRKKTFRVYGWQPLAKGFRPGISHCIRTPYLLEKFGEWAGTPKKTGKPDTRDLWIVEGEKAVHALTDSGRAATTFQGGAGGARPEDWVDWVREFQRVRVWPDADRAGVAWGRAVVKEIQEAQGPPVALWGPEHGTFDPKDDAYDVVNRGEKPTRIETPDHLAHIAAGGVEDAEGKPAKPEDAYPFNANVDPYEFADEIVRRHFNDRDGVRTLRYHPDGTYWIWKRDHYRPVGVTTLKGILRKLLKFARETDGDGKTRQISLKTSVVDSLARAMADSNIVSDMIDGNDLEPQEGVVPFRNGCLDVATREMKPHTPQRDVRWVIEAEYTTSAECPEWHKFLESIGWGESAEEYQTLRQWMGYLLSGRTDLQKAFVVKGPTRSGKGTILYVCELLMGDGSAATALAKFKGDNTFGLQNLVGKGLATMGDARFRKNTDASVVENLLRWISADRFSIDKKNKDPLEHYPTARIMLATNETPQFPETSNALSNRFIFLTMAESFLNREDPNLKHRLAGELPGIAMWALAGLDDLEETGKFVQPASAEVLRNEVEAASDPINGYYQERCVPSPGHMECKDDLYEDYRWWARGQGTEDRYVVSKQFFFWRLNTIMGGVLSLDCRKGPDRITAVRGLCLVDSV